ncbi:MAG: hypothetical protein PHE17_21330 [Thiothrix sp.]|uniref:hypothetical protein n=1 Tax=Thiothrix sp. TaxID=1032 RepID=UPI00260EA872|nr:hypothetical protein [Thiothrix sp.]MDD5395573.1 hypothetical protein [Thiothrix sp.]
MMNITPDLGAIFSTPATRQSANFADVRRHCYSHTDHATRPFIAATQRIKPQGAKFFLDLRCHDLGYWVMVTVELNLCAECVDQGEPAIATLNPPESAILPIPEMLRENPWISLIKQIC